MSMVSGGREAALVTPHHSEERETGRKAEKNTQKQDQGHSENYFHALWAHAGSTTKHHPRGCNLNSTFGCTQVHPIPMPGPDPAPRGVAARGAGSHGGGWALRAGLTHLGALARRFGSWEKARVTLGTQGLRLRPTQAAWCSREPLLAASPRNRAGSKSKTSQPQICLSPLTPPVP